ncbi:Flp family type IVb pilin [Blastomonas sp.]|uniref:Flp family type IVb pilin n=1 Tax=Blastomonas sp. TaxID=1909299 RepID=UPI003BDBA414
MARSKRGATAIEYGLIVALIGITIIVSMSSMASKTIGMWDFVEEKIVPKEE